MHFSGIFPGIYLVYYSQIMIIWNVTKINYRLSSPVGTLNCCNNFAFTYEKASTTVNA